MNLDKYHEYLQVAVKAKAKQLTVLTTGFTVCLSLIAIVFGINANTLENYARPEEARVYDFTSLFNILNFPLNQWELYDGETRHLGTDFNNNKQTGLHHVIIIDASSSVDTDGIHSEIIYKHLEDKGLVNDTTPYDPMALMALWIKNYLGFNNNNVTIGFWVESLAPKKRSLQLFNVKYDTVFNRTKFADHLNHGFKTASNRDGRTDLGNLINELLRNPIYNQKKDFVVTILSDFWSSSDNSNLEYQLQNINRNHPKLRLNLIRLGCTESEVVDSIESHLNLIHKFTRSTIIPIDEIWNITDVDTIFSNSIFSLFPVNSFLNDEHLNLVTPTPKINNDDFDYEMSNRKITIENGSGNYLIRFINRNDSLYGANRNSNISYYYKGITETKFFNGETFIWNGQDISINKPREDKSGMLGELIIYDIDNKRSAIYTLWEKKRLNKAGIAFYTLFLTTGATIAFILLLSFTQTIFLPKIDTIYLNKRLEVNTTKAFFSSSSPFFRGLIYFILYIVSIVIIYFIFHNLYFSISFIEKELFLISLFIWFTYFFILFFESYPKRRVNQLSVLQKKQ